MNSEFYITGDEREPFSTTRMTLKREDPQAGILGPQGQERQETERIVVGAGMIKQGDIEYQLSVTQKDTKVLDPRQNIPNTADKESIRVLGRYRYGLNKNISLQTGIMSQDIHDTRHDYLNFGALGYVNDTFISGDFIHDPAGGNAIEGLVQKKIGPLDFKLKQQFYKDFVREGYQPR